MTPRNPLGPMLLLSLLAATLVTACSTPTWRPNVLPTAPRYQIGCSEGDTDIHILIDADGPGRLHMRVARDYCGTDA